MFQVARCDDLLGSDRIFHLGFGWITLDYSGEPIGFEAGFRGFFRCFFAKNGFVLGQIGFVLALNWLCFLGFYRVTIGFVRQKACF